MLDMMMMMFKLPWHNWRFVPNLLEYKCAKNYQNRA